MRFKALIILVIFTLLSVCLIVFSESGKQGALTGIRLSYSIVIPSLFPFTVFSLIILETKVFDYIEYKLYKHKIRINLSNFAIYIMSCIGGFPVGAKLIEQSFINGKISKKNAELMLGYCVNSAPSFIIITVGSGIIQNVKIGYILFIANVLSSLVIFLFSNLLKEKVNTINSFKMDNIPFSEVFVKCTYDATNSMLGICGFVILFSTIISIIDCLFTAGTVKNLFLSLLEITNGVLMLKNIYAIAFIIGFSGICVHFQIFSMCKKLRPNYIRFLMFRILHGFLMMVIVKISSKIFNISLNTLSMNTNYTPNFSQTSVIFGILLIALSVFFIISVRQCNNI